MQKCRINGGLGQTKMIPGTANRVVKPTPLIEVRNRGTNVKAQQVSVPVRSPRVAVSGSNPRPEQEARNAIHPSAQVNIFHVEEESFIKSADGIQH